MRLSGVKIATLLKATKPVVGRFAAKHGKLSVNAIQSGVPGDGSLPQGQGSFENDPQRLASKLAATTAGAVSAMEGPLTAIKSVISAYNTALTKYPVATKALTSLCGFALGDRIAQSVGGAPFDIFRCLRLSMYGLLIDGPVGHYFYQFLDKNISPEDPKGVRAVFSKTAVDQLIWAPIMTVVFLAFLTTLEGRPEAVLSIVQAKLLPIMMANFGVWPLAHLINFRYVAPEQRILFNNCIAIAWTTYLSYMCGGGADGHFGTPRDALAAGIPCALGGGVLFNPTGHVLDIARQTSAVESMLRGWGADGLPNAEAGAELLVNYAHLKAEVVRTVCASHPTGPLQQ